MLTLELIEGVRIDELGGVEASGADRGELARRLAGVLFRSALERGFFHADPHPGNFLLEPGGTVVVLDFGMMGYLSPRERNGLIETLLAVVENDPERATDRLLDLGLRTGGAESRALQRELGKLFYDYADLPLGELPMGGDPAAHRRDRARAAAASAGAAVDADQDAGDGGGARPPARSERSA